MIDKLFSRRHSTLWLLFHVFIGIISGYTTIFLICWIFIIFFIQIIKIRNNPRINLIFIITYLSSMETICRYSNTSPFIPYESGKYFTFILILAGFIFGYKTKLKSGIFVLLLFVPGIFIGLNKYNNPSELSDIVFNVLGTINIVFIIMFFYKEKISQIDFINLLRLFLLPSVSALTFIIFNSEALSSVDFNLKANFDTVANFSSNQVSTVFGAAITVLTIMIIQKWKFSNYRFIDVSLLVLFILRTLFSFSRGGIVVATISLAFFFLFRNRKKTNFVSSKKKSN